MSYEFGSFESGRSQAREVIAFLKSIDSELSVSVELKESDPRLTTIFNWISERWGTGRPLPYLNGFLGGILMPEGISS